MTPEQIEVAIDADLSAGLCQKCQNDDIYERSPEACRECARLRVTAVLLAYDARPR